MNTPTPVGEPTPAPWTIRFFTKDGKDDGEAMFFIEAANNNKPELGYGIEILQDDFGDHNGYPRAQRLADAQLIADARNKQHRSKIGAIEFLKEKGVLLEGHKYWIVNFDDGRSFDIAQLLSEYALRQGS